MSNNRIIKIINKISNKVVNLTKINKNSNQLN